MSYLFFSSKSIFRPSVHPHHYIWKSVCDYLCCLTLVRFQVSKYTHNYVYVQKIRVKYVIILRHTCPFSESSLACFSLIMQREDLRSFNYCRIKKGVPLRMYFLFIVSFFLYTSSGGQIFVYGFICHINLMNVRKWVIRRIASCGASFT